MSLQSSSKIYNFLMWKTYNIKAKFLTALVPNLRNNHLGTRSRIPPLTKGSLTLAISIYDNSFAAMGPKLGTPSRSKVRCIQIQERSQDCFVNGSKSASEKSRFLQIMTKLAARSVAEIFVSIYDAFDITLNLAKSI